MGKSAKLTWVGPGLRLVAESGGSPAIIVDSSHEGMGTHSGPTAMELVLMGMGSCTGMDVLAILNKRREPVTGYEVRLEAERAEEHPKVYTKVHIEYVIYGEGVNPDSVERAIELSTSKYCSVIGMVKHTAEITTSYRIVEDKVAPYNPQDKA